MSICSSYVFPLNYALSENAYQSFLRYDEKNLFEKCKHCKKVIRKKVLNFANGYDKEKHPILFLTEKSHGSVKEKDFFLTPDDVNVRNLLMSIGIIPSEVKFRNERVQSSNKAEDVYILFGIEWKIHFCKYDNVWFLQLDSREFEAKNFVSRLLKIDEIQLPRIMIKPSNTTTAIVPDTQRILTSKIFKYLKNNSLIVPFQDLFSVNILQALVFYSKIWLQKKEPQNNNNNRSVVLQAENVWNTHQARKFLKHSPWTISTPHGSLAIGAESPLEWIFSAVIFQPKLNGSENPNLVYMMPLPSFGNFDLYSSSLKETEIKFVKNHFNLDDITRLKDSIDIFECIFHHVRENSTDPTQRMQELFKPLIPFFPNEKKIDMWNWGKIINFYKTITKLSNCEDWLDLKHDMIDIWFSSEEIEDVYSRKEKILVHLPIIPFGKWIDVVAKP